AALIGAEPFQRHWAGFTRGWGHDIIDDGTIARKADGRTHRHAALDRNDLLPLASRFPAAVVQETIRMRRVGFFLVQVAFRADVVGATPCDSLRTTEHDCGHANVGHAADIEGPTAQMDLVPPRDGIKRNVRIAG